MTQTLQKEKMKVTHMLNWKETPEGEVLTLQAYGTLMKSAGEACKKLQEQVAGVKGMISARKARTK